MAELFGKKLVQPMEMKSYEQDHSEKRFDKFFYSIDSAKPTKKAMLLEEFFSKFSED